MKGQIKGRPSPAFPTHALSVCNEQGYGKATTPAQQMIGTQREAEVHLAEGKMVQAVCRKFAI